MNNLKYKRRKTVLLIPTSIFFYLNFRFCFFTWKKILIKINNDDNG